jgi:ribose transport system ATP-binding protein
MNEQHSLLQIDGVTKTFPGVRALDNVTFSVLAGEVHGLVGENGAGKSTLMAVASGALVPESGRVVINGVETKGDTEQARRLGLAIVRQEPALMPDLGCRKSVSRRASRATPFFDEHKRLGSTAASPME